MKAIYFLILSTFLCSAQDLTPLPHGSDLYSAQELTPLPHGSDLFSGETSNNYIFGWHFQHICDHMFDPERNNVFDPLQVQAGDLIFVRNIDLFMKTLHDRISNPYIIVTHGDFQYVTTDENLQYLDNEKIIAWFSVHPPRSSHPKYFPVPLGINPTSKLFKFRKRYNNLFKKLRDKPKTKLLSGIFSLRHNPEREELGKLFSEKPFCSLITKNLHFREYMDELASSIFTFSPRGWGPDCYRTWEALLVGTIPIVKKEQYGIMECAKQFLRMPNNGFPSQLDRLYEDLPILVIEEWNEITPEFLEKKYKEISAKKYDIKLLYMEYWYEKIREVQRNYLANHKK
ncbi:hypothetical protein H0X06_02685 [Candidatus Dependentiae bacterium]|nr:hypothetical protein [Candidatus Dependentiae bacterium]